ncbi:MAG: hypothetical protein U0893_04225 [Chloroflexota bacterium]
MTHVDDQTFSSLFLADGDLPARMRMYADGRGGFVEESDQAFRRYGGLRVGMTKWEAPVGVTGPYDAVVDIRWLFPSAQGATHYHLDTLQMKAEGKPENTAAPTIGSHCHVYSYSSGGPLGMARAMFGAAGLQGTLTDRGQPVAPITAHSIEETIARMPHDGFIYLFTVGSVPVKLFVMLKQGVSTVDPATGQHHAHALARRAVERVNAAGLGAGRSWWQKLFRS